MTTARRQGLQLDDPLAPTEPARVGFGAACAAVSMDAVSRAGSVGASGASS